MPAAEQRFLRIFFVCDGFLFISLGKGHPPPPPKEIIFFCMKQVLMKRISACLDVLQVAACHCRVHETYKRCFPSAAPLLPCKVTRLEEVVKPCRCELFNRFVSNLSLSCFSYSSSFHFSSSHLLPQLPIFLSPHISFINLSFF
jgi:hypothetical protein